MGELLAFAGMGSIAALLLWTAHQSALGRRNTWRVLAQELGLTVLSEGSSLFVAHLNAEGPGGVVVRFEDYQRSRHETRTRMILGPLPAIGNLSLAPEGFGTGLQKMIGGREIEIGDAAFDRAFFVGGPPNTALAFLDDKTRRGLLSATGYADVELRRGELRSETRDDSMGGLRAVLKPLLAVSIRLRERVPLAERLAANVREDPQPAFRLNCLQLLIREHWKAATAREALQAACRDTAPAMRLRAAIELGAEGEPVLRQLVETTTDDYCAAEAVRALAPRLDAAQAQELLQRALKARRLATAEACVTLLGRHSDPESVRRLTKVLNIEDGSLAVAAAAALGATGATAAEAPLLLAVRREPLKTRIAVATALGRVGTVDAVLPLKELSELIWDPDFRRAARQAIAEIQARIAGASPGQLSVAAADAGQVSLANTEAGRVSMTNGEAGHVSLVKAKEGPAKP